MSVHAIKRRFIRLEEISEKTYLTKGDIFDAIDSGQLSFSALVEAKKLGALTQQDGHLKVAAVFDYNGMVNLLGEVSKQYSLTLQSNLTERFVVLQPDNIRNWLNVVKAFGNFSESGFKYLTQAPNQPSKPFVAYSGLEMVPTVNNMLGSFADGLAGLVSAVVPDADIDELRKKHPKNESMRLQTKSIKVEPERLRLDLEEIEKVFGSEVIKGIGLTVSPVVECVSQTNSNMVSTAVLTHPIEKIVYRVLVSHAQIRADKIWNLIRQDVKLETNRQYDTDLVIDEITQDDVQWFAKGDTVNSMSYDSFRKNTVTGVRKFINNQK